MWRIFALLEPGGFLRAVVVEEATHRLGWRRLTPAVVTRVDVALLKHWHEELFGLLVCFVVCESVGATSRRRIDQAMNRQQFGVVA